MKKQDLNYSINKLCEVAFKLNKEIGEFEIRLSKKRKDPDYDDLKSHTAWTKQCLKELNTSINILKGNTSYLDLNLQDFDKYLKRIKWQQKFEQIDASGMYPFFKQWVSRNKTKHIWKQKVKQFLVSFEKVD